MAFLKNKIVIMFSVLMVMEFVLLYFFLGGPSQLEDPEKEKLEDIYAGTTEVRLGSEDGKYKVTNTADLNNRMQVSCLIALVLDEDKLDDFNARYEKVQMRISEVITEELANARHEHLQEKEHPTLKRRIITSLIQILGPENDFVKDLVITNLETYSEP